MIAKHVSMTSAGKSDFSGLVKYITGPQGKNERVGTVRMTNCATDDSNSAILEVLNTQRINTRTHADKTYHLIISFPANEMPDAATLEAIEDRLCAGLGLGEHQRISVVHHDTDNLHVHVAINKIHPTRHSIHEPYNAYHVLARLCEKLEREYGLKQDNHKAEKSGSENRASDMERNAATESLLGWIKRECTEKIRHAATWNELHDVMRDHGLRIHERANGVIMTNDDGVSVKASSVSREFSKANLEARLGKFTPSKQAENDEKLGKRYKRDPLRSRIDTTKLHGRFKEGQKVSASTRSAEWAKAIARKNRLVEDAKRQGRLKRSLIKLVDAPRFGKKLMYAATSKTLVDEIAAINRQYLKERQAIFDKYKRREWADWLRSEATAGDAEALEALRARSNFSGLRGDTVGGKNSASRSDHYPGADSITKKGTIIYRAGNSTVRDDGDRLSVSRGLDHAGVEVLLRMAMERYGSCVRVNGSATFKEKIVRAAVALDLDVSFDDELLEYRRQQLANARKTKESTNGSYNNEGAAIRSRANRNGHGTGGQAPTARSAGAGQRSTSGTQSDAGDARQAATSTAPHGLRGLSELGVVYVTNRGEVLLPRHVCGHLEHKRSKPADRVRRNVRRPGRLKREAPATRAAAEARITSACTESRATECKPNIAKVGTAPPPASRDSLKRLSQLQSIIIGENIVLNTGGSITSRSAKPDATPYLRAVAKNPVSAADAAADKYIAESERTRAKGIQIPKHVPFQSASDARPHYAGTRYVDGQALALLEMRAEIIVLPVDEQTARRLKHVALGQEVDLTAKGIIKMKGWRR